MLWQALHETSFSWCLPDSQKAKWRLPAWQVMHTWVCAAAGAFGPNLFGCGFFTGSLAWLGLLPWHAVHDVAPPPAGARGLAPAPCCVKARPALFSWHPAAKQDWSGPCCASADLTGI